MFVYCVYPAMTKHFKATAILSEKGITSVVLIILNCVLYDVHVYTVTVFIVLHESGTRKALLGP